MKTTDDKIKELMDLVASKKAAISQAEQPQWKTNCVLSKGHNLSEKFNIQTIKDIKFFVQELSYMFIYKKTWEEANSLLGTSEKFVYAGFSLSDWIHDFEQRITQIQISDKKKELAALEERLNKIVSPELRAKMEIEAIENALK